jgi:microsomal dipeptidase-like Zn-dependent dipeptidase
VLRRQLPWWDEAANIVPVPRKRGFSEAEVTGVMGVNFMRAFGETWNG